MTTSPHLYARRRCDSHVGRRITLAAEEPSGTTCAPHPCPVEHVDAARHRPEDATQEVFRDEFARKGPLRAGESI